MSFWCLHFLPKNERKQVDKYIVKSNLFVRFLEKTSAWKNHFEYVWPLLTANLILKLVIYVEYEIISTRQNYEKQNLRKTKLNVWPRVSLSISCKAKISKHVRWWTALVNCARGQKTRQILPHLWPRVHIFNSSNTEISTHLTCSKLDRVFKFSLPSKNSSNTSLYMLQV